MTPYRFLGLRKLASPSSIRQKDSVRESLGIVCAFSFLGLAANLCMIMGAAPDSVKHALLATLGLPVILLGVGALLLLKDSRTEPSR